MKAPSSIAKKTKRPPTKRTWLSVGLRELKARASAIVDDVQQHHVAYAVTRRGVVTALIVPVDLGERLTHETGTDEAWETLHALREQLAETGTASAEGCATR